MFCLLKGCPKCTGDLILDGDEWRCWQCGQRYYPAQLLAKLLLGPSPAVSLPPAVECQDATVKRRRYSRRDVRNVNSLILAKNRSDERWWGKNQQIIQYLDEGRTVREISILVGRGERQIRVVRERLNDLRAADGLSLSA